MLREGFNHGFSDADWAAAKEEARQAMIARARLRGMITYTDLVRSIRRIRLEPHDTRLDHLLGEVASEEDEAGRGMLTVLVVHKTGDMQPGPGFYEMAKKLGKPVSNLMDFWVSELHRVHAVWSK